MLGYFQFGYALFEKRTDIFSENTVGMRYFVNIFVTITFIISKITKIVKETISAHYYVRVTFKM